MMRASRLDIIRAHLAAFFCTYPEFSRWLDRNHLDVGPGNELVRKHTGDAHRHLCIIVGRWKLENWHVYRYAEHGDGKTGWQRII
jgi:hypothetical protein